LLFLRLAAVIGSLQPQNILQKTGAGMKLRHIRIITKDVLALARFYEEITGVTPSGTDDFREFITSAGAFAISSEKKIREHWAAAAIPGANRSVILDFEVEDVDKERVRLNGVVKQFVLEPTNQPWGNRSMLFRDPDGNLVNFFTPQHRTVSQPKPEHVSI
jgi:catechol 2,3-dioxygenase-like lactoylglutathione lyase family enzyme